MHTHKIRKIIKVIIPVAIVCLFLTSTNPKHMPSVLLIAPFLLFALILYQLVLAIFGFLNGTYNDDITKTLVARPRLLAVIVAAFPVLLLLLQSIGQLSFRDVLTVALIFVVTYIYLDKYSLGRAVY